MTTPHEEKQVSKKARTLWQEGIPGWCYPSGITLVALLGWVLAGFGVGEFMTLATSGNNYIVELLFVSLGGFVTNKWVKGRNNHKDQGGL